MNKFFNYYNSLCVGANTPTIFSVDPYVTAIKELFVSELQQIVYYIEKLKDLAVDMSEYTDKVIEFISVLIVNLDFKKESFFIIIEDLYNNKKMLEKMYISACEKAGKTPQLLPETKENLSSKEIILKALNDSERNIQGKISKIHVSKERKILYDIMINLVLNSCNCLIELKDYDVDFEGAKNQVLKLLNTTNFPSLTDEELILVIKNFSLCNYKIMKILYESIIKKFGPVKKTKVSIIMKKGKAILVSGHSIQDLEKVLLSVKGLNINVYTHHEMINAFQYEKFSKYSNLIGHYQKSNNNFPIDFASFPGPIYISKNSAPKIDVIRGQIYTASKYPAYGIAKIENGDFSPLIKYALDSKGFEEDIEINEIQIGYNEQEIYEKVQLITAKFKNKEINNILIIGLIDKFNFSDKYINDFLKFAPVNDFIISFSYYKERDNFWRVNSYYDFGVVYKVIELLSENAPDICEKISIFLPDCNSDTISHIFNLIHLKINNIFLGHCCPNIINPAIVEGLKDLFNINPLSTANEDIKNLK